MDELRYPRNETSPMNSLVSPPRNGNRLSQTNSSHDPRRHLPRRFTTESTGSVTTLSNGNIIPNNQRTAETQSELSTRQRVHLIEQKKQDYEKLVSQKRQFQREMAMLEQAQRREEQELAKLQQDLALNTGHQSEPTTPPEYQEPLTGYSTMISRPNRYSTSSIVSPTGMFSRGLSSGALPSPQAAAMSQTRFALDDQLPLRMSQQRGDDDDDDDKELAVRQDPTSHRSTNHLNRYSMPVTRSRTGLYDFASLDQANTARFLFGDEETTPTEHQFPNQEDNYSTPGRGDMERHSSVSSVNGAPASAATSDIGTNSRPASIRHSMELNIAEAAAGVASAGGHVNTPPRLQSTFSSTNEVPTLKSNGPAGINNHAQQHLHNHNVSIGRIPAGALPVRHGREMSTDSTAMQGGRDHTAAYGSIGSALQGGNPGYVPINATTQAGLGVTAAPTPVGHMANFYGQQPYNSNTQQQLALMMGSLNLVAAAPQQGSYVYPSGQVATVGGVQPRDSQQRVIQSRRLQDNNESMARFNGKSVSDFAGRIYDTCKDQFGCRFLQRELEHRKPADVHSVWLETHQHVVELMMDPFGNYLCQKLLEYCNEDDRTKLIEAASRDMVRIALNQHGTRALQKMIEHVGTPEQVAMITDALRNKVVELIQDLNGNHVIQKCLNKLSADDAIFIFEAVGHHCVDVGTHRHGCCVLQRCIDHAAGEQKRWLVDRITENATTLVVDPFGNYVVQYIIDLNEPAFTEPLVRTFASSIITLSKHKFSSNVIEKCLRCALEPSRDMIVTELLAANEMERILKDSYANYVVQTALDYATPAMKQELVNVIRPLLPAIRHTPYGRRIQTKVNQYEADQVTPDTMGGQISLRAPLNTMQNTNNRSILLGNGEFGDSMHDTGLGGHDTANYARGPLVQPAPFPTIDAAVNQTQGYNLGHTTGPVRHHAMMSPSAVPMPRAPQHLQQQTPMMPQGMHFQPMHMAVQGLARGTYPPSTPNHHVQHNTLVQLGGHNQLGNQMHQRHVPPSPAATPRSQTQSAHTYGYNPNHMGRMGMDESTWL